MKSLGSDETASLSETHAAILQTVLGGMSVPASKLASLLAEYDPEDDALLCVAKINTAIAPVGLRIVSAVDEASGELVYLLKNTKEAALYGESPYSPSETRIAEKTVECVMEQDGQIESVSLINRVFHKCDKKTPHQEIENTLDMLVREGWFVDREGVFALGVRTVVDLEHHLKEAYPEKAVFCAACSRIALQPKICTDCGAQTHRTCSPNACYVCAPCVKEDTNK
ncbi:MAG: Smc5-6 complex non-SMC subunit 1 [Amphiamblys sp. WSBS2006]|nr:MAG: Smc5-6 complex non-SMC subunit 1 [Amphiamblys sp. WSBS2006]